MLKPFIRLMCLLTGVVVAGCAGSPKTDVEPKADAKPLTAKAKKAAAKHPEVNPQTALQYERALTALKNGADDDALAQFKAITEKTPNLAGPFINIGLIHLKKNRYAEAELAFTQAAAANEDNPAAHTYLGVALREQGKFDKAGNAYEQALAADEKYPDAHLNAGILYDIYLNELGRALAHYEKYQSLTDNKDEQVAKWIADIKLRQSRAK